ncbi:flagellar export chaperone FliS [Paenibacillus kobensis]|uniref:flagellar export chaperone FliS n=1 Tax=Paenibacillus kobensis TaxID=59841 RepID=UPI000FDBB1D8|nr:flagellar export chaperone FliS [Paenibacillus kobensis]
MITPQEQYLLRQVQTASPGELTLMLYNGCIRFMKQAETAIKAKNAPVKHEYIIKAQNIIDELQVTLNSKYEISSNLDNLYSFMKSQLVRANISMDTAVLQNCIELMTELRDTWAEAIKQLKNGQVSS